MGDQDALTAPAKSRTATVPRRRTLLVLAGDEVAVHALPLAGERTVGRGANADIVVEEPSLSRLHLTLAFDEHGVSIIDHGSANGTALRGVRLPSATRVQVRANEPIAVGDVVLVIQEIGEQPSTPAPRDVRPSGTLAGGARPIVADAAMKQLYDLAARVARGTISVLVAGETGAGKELLCELIHAGSPRAAGPLVRVNCAVLTENLAESELFGHDKGAFTGATAARTGYLEAADGGTLMLDEVGELPLGLQSKLLRVVEERMVTRVGSTQPRAIDVRFVAATNRDLEAEVAAGRFRHDLYFRIAGVVLAIPPLRERPGDIEVLAVELARRGAERLGRPPPRFSSDAIAKLRAHAWPGNVRELRNVIERALLMLDGELIGPAELGLVAAAVASAPASLTEELATLERRRILEALERCHGNQTKAAELLGMPRRTLINRLEAYAVERPRRGK